MLNKLADLNPYLPLIAGLGILVLTAFAAAFITKWLWVALVRMLVTRTHTTWDDALVKEKTFSKLGQIVPAVLIYRGILLVPNVPDLVDKVTQNVAAAWIITAIAMALNSALAAFNCIYEVTPAARERPIKGFVQLAQIGVWLVSIILIIAVMIDQSPVIMLSGLGAMTAVAMLVFQDTLLSLAASVQLTGQKIVRVGDWLEMPSYNANGDVVDVALYNVTVQNFDKTFTIIPTNKLVSGAFKNWRGMEESGGRRIKRSINIDITSIRLLTDDEFKRFSDFALLKDYISTKEADLQAYNDALNSPGESDVNLRRLTNIGTFRAYTYNYLKNHPKIRLDMTLIVRQLQSGDNGVPIQIYAFCNDTDWFNYEGIQSDIFDHLFAIAPEFGLHVYQSPTGTDFQLLGSNSSQS